MMEAFALYLFKSVIWLTGFALIFILFLRNERFFFLNRIYLIAGILSSFFLPLISIHYTVILPAVTNFQTGIAVVSRIQEPADSFIPDLKLALLVLYSTGSLFVLTLVIRQALSVIKAIKKSEVIALHQVKLIKTTDYASSFSFFSYVFVNPSITDIETKEIMNHELVHIRQKHWFDLLLAELLCMIQWFNPFVWMYVRFIRQNHEYLADEVALQHTSDPAIYKAVLLNQIVGAPVVSLTNSFNYSPNKKRFNMMKNIIRSPYRKLKILLVLPVFAIVLYSFAKPDYKYINVTENSVPDPAVSTQTQKEVKGIIVKGDGVPLDGANITVIGTTIGTSSDSKGNFKLANLSDADELVVSYVGFRTKMVKPVFTSVMTIKMIRDTIPVSHSGNSSMPPPPPPPPPPAIDAVNNINNPDAPPPLYIIDGVITAPADVKNIDPDLIVRIDVLKDKGDDKRVTAEHGDKAKNGVVMITTKKNTAESGETPLNIVSADGKTPLYIIDGVEYKDDIKKISPESIESITVLKDESATAVYGEKGKSGVLLITTKKKAADAVDKTSPSSAFVVMEEMPSYKGGVQAMQTYIAENLKYPEDAKKNKITGSVPVNFTVTSSGKVKDAKVITSVNPLLDAEAVRVVNSLPDWKPGSQNGKAIDVRMKVNVDFSLQ